MKGRRAPKLYCIHVSETVARRLAGRGTRAYGIS